MKKLNLLLILLLPVVIRSQTTAAYDSSMQFISASKIQFNAVTPPKGFKVYYNCDSMLFMKGNFGDTIKIWTPGFEWFTNLNQFKENIQTKDFGITKFAKSIDYDGRIFVSTYHQTEFIYRNDSLFEIGDANPGNPEIFTQLFNDYYFKKQITKQTYEARLDSIRLVEAQQAVYTPKLIFAKQMFKGKSKVRMPRRFNFEEDTIQLERKWIHNGKTAYLIRITNKTEDGEQTSYAYAIDEDMKFIYWEGCDNNQH